MNDKPEKTWRFEKTADMQSLHPRSWRELRQLVLLHGAEVIQCAVKHIEEQQRTESK